MTWEQKITGADFIHYIYFYLLIHFVFFIYFLFIYFYLFLNPPEAICHCALREARGSRFFHLYLSFFSLYMYVHTYTHERIYNCTHAHTYSHAGPHIHLKITCMFPYVEGGLTCTYYRVLIHTHTHIHTFIARIRGYSSLSHSLTHIVRLRKYMMHHIYLHMHTPMRTYIYVRLCFLFVYMFQTLLR